MNYLLTIFLLIIFIVQVIINKKNLICPSVIFSISFFISSFVFSMNTQSWKYEISTETFGLIVLGVLLFNAGSNLRKKVRISNSIKINIKSDAIEVILHKIGNGSFSTNIFIALGIFAIAIQFLSLYYGTHTVNFLNAIVLRSYRSLENKSFLNIIKLFTPIMEAISIIQISKISQYKLIHKKIQLTEYIPIIETFIFTVLSSGRVIVIYLFFYIIFLHVFTNQMSRQKKSGYNLFRIICYSVGAMSILTIIFFVLGMLTGKSQVYSSGILENISLYAGSSIPALDSWLKSFKYSTSNFGRMTFFTGIGHFLVHFGVKQFFVISDEYIMIGNMEHGTNVYTMLRTLIYDFNFFGMLVSLFVLGYFFQSLYAKAVSEYRCGRPFWINIYIYGAAYLGVASIEDKIFRSFFTFTTILFIIANYVFCKGNKKV